MTHVWHNDYLDHPDRQCHGKRTYQTHAQAKAAIKRLKGRGAGILGHYRCQHCQAIHLGHPPAGNRAKRAS